MPAPIHTSAQSSSAVPSHMSPDAAGTRGFSLSASPAAPHGASASDAHPACTSDSVTGTVHTGSVNGDGGGHAVMRTVHGEHGIDADTGTVPTGSGDGEGACASGVPGLSVHASRPKRCARHVGGHRNLVWPRPRDPTQVNSAVGGSSTTNLHQPATSEYLPVFHHCSMTSLPPTLCQPFCQRRHRHQIPNLIRPSLLQTMPVTSSMPPSGLSSVMGSP